MPEIGDNFLVWQNCDGSAINASDASVTDTLMNALQLEMGGPDRVLVKTLACWTWRTGFDSQFGQKMLN